MCMVTATRDAYRNPFPIPTIKGTSSSSFALAFRMIIVLMNIRIVVPINSAMHPCKLLKKVFGVQNRNLLLCVVVINCLDSNGVLSCTDAESNIPYFLHDTFPAQMFCIVGFSQRCLSLPVHLILTFRCIWS